MQPGIYYDISNEDYHRGAGISKSQLDDIAINPAIFQWRKEAPEDDEKKAALDMGTALHCLLLEPEEFDKRFIVAPAFNRRTNEGKADEQRFLKDCESSGMTVMDAEQGRKLKLMRASASPIRRHAGCLKLKVIRKRQFTGMTSRQANFAVSVRTSSCRASQSSST